MSTGTIQTYDFEYYVKNTLPNEWISSWKAASLETGAMAVKSYGWYWVNYWRGGSLNGSCYDVQGGSYSGGGCDVNYQCFRPGTAVSSTDTAVDKTWTWGSPKYGSVFEATYNSGYSSDTCGEDDGTAATGSEMSQWGTQACALDGYGWQHIFTTYYFNGVHFLASDFSAPAIGVNASNNSQYVFWRHQANGDTYEAYYTGSWHGPQDMHSKYGWGGNIASAPNVAVAPDGNEWVFWRGTQGDIYEAWYTSSNGTWSKEDMTTAKGWGQATSAIAVGVNPSNDQQYVFWRGENGDTYEAYYTGSWHGPQDMHSKYGWGGNIASAPNVAVASDGSEYVFWRGTQGDIYGAFYNGSWYRLDMTLSYGW